MVQKTLCFILKNEPATQGDLRFGRGESLSGGGEGATGEEVREVWSRELARSLVRSLGGSLGATVGANRKERGHRG